MKRIIFILAFVFSVGTFAQTNMQFFYDFGSQNTACENQRTKRTTLTIEHLSMDKWGSNFFFVDFDFGLTKNDPKHSPFGAYTELARTLNFWQDSKMKNLSLHIEYNGGLGLYNGGGFGINNTQLYGLEYILHTNDYSSILNFQLLYRYQRKSNVKIPLQFTAVWTIKDLFKVKNLHFGGYIDFYDGENKFAFTSEPQLWYNIGRLFECPALNIGTEIEFSYNFCGEGFMCNPCVGLKWIL